MSERSRRASRLNNSKTQAALDRLKKIRSGEGRAIDYDQEEEDVFEYMDDDEYSEIVRKRTENDWIVDDHGGQGYYEDGREVFDDVDEENGGESYYENYNSTGGKKVPLKRNQNSKTSASSSTSKKKIGNMKNYLLSNQKNVQKKSFDQMKVEDDDLLKGILDDINTSTSTAQTMSQPINLNQSIRSKRKLDDFNDENLISTPNNPFSVSTETNAFIQNKKQRNDSFDVDLDDDLMMNDLDDLNDKNHFEETSISQKDENDLMEKSMNTSTIAEQSFSTQNLQLCNDDILMQDENGNKFLKMFWIDAYEDQRQPGIINIFGKLKVVKENVSQFLSCCLICRNVEHKVFFHKRIEHKKEDLEKEIKTVLEQNKIRNYRSRWVVKNYAFDKDVETKGHYLEVLFNPTQYNIFKLSANLSGETFSHVFNYSQSSLERFIIDLKLKGPSWLKIKNPKSSTEPISWCKFEYVIDCPFKQISIDVDDQSEIPLSIMFLSIKSHLNPITKQHEILTVSCMTKNDYLIGKNNDKIIKSKTNDVDNFCIITEPKSSKSTVNPIKFPPKFKEKWDRKISSNFQVIVASDEKELINLLITKLFQKKDPDILIGHELNSFDLNIIKKRLEHHKIMGRYWSKMGKLRRCLQVEANDRDLRILNVGRLICDIEIAAKELIRSKSYDLKELALQILKREQPDYKPENLANYYKSIDSLKGLIDLSVEDIRLIYGLFAELNVLPLYSEITKIAGNLFSRTLLGGRSERNEYLLLHAFNEHNYILPDKSMKDDKKQIKLNEDVDCIEEKAAVTLSSNKRNKKAAYTGGLVLEPKVGLYDKYILLMDFNSLYPSIIQEYKICFTTVDRQQFLECLKENNDGDLDRQPEIRKDNVDKEGFCILPAEIKKLVDERRKVKSLMLQTGTSDEMKQQLDIKQKALKLTANSMYGCLGFGNSRFYAKPLAALITMKGREILSKTKQLVEESSLKLEVIYGDTDSLMINTKSNTYEEAENLGYKLKAEVNKNYNLLEIDIDGIFKSILLLKKKKYAALVATKTNGKLSFKKEIKGLDIIRRDWSLIAKNVGEKILNELLTEDNRPSEQIIENIHNYLSTIAGQINKKELPTGLYIISKQLTKDLKDYKDAKGQPHALVAIRWNENSTNPRKFKAGDVVQYVICKSKENKDNFNSLPSTQRAFHPEELKKRDDIEIDAKYYLQSQIHPIVSRLIDPIDGTDANVIAEFLGIESTFSSGNQKGTDLDYELLTRTNETRFDTCKSLILICPNKNCKEKITFRSLVEKDTGTGKFRLNFDRCVKCSVSFADDVYRNYFVNHFTVYLRSLISDYYQTWYTCEDPICKFKTRRLTSLMTKKGPICPECNENILYPEITDAQFYLQLNFMAHILDTKRVIGDLPKLENDNLKEIKIRLNQLMPFYTRLFEIVQNFKKQQAYDVVDLTFLFSKQVFSFVKLD